jgi:5-carboxymethyl-2-hydroxymuconate isomerase
MPIVTMTVQQPKTEAFKTGVLNVVHEALVASGVHPGDLFQRVLELPRSDFRYDRRFPDLNEDRTDDFILLEIMLGIGRSVKAKRRVLSDIMVDLAALDINPEHVMVCFIDVPWENWSPGGGRMPHV